MHEEQPVFKPSRGWVFYDNDCTLCTRLVNVFRPLLSHYGFDFVPLQTDWAKERLLPVTGGKRAILLKELRVILNQSPAMYGGADAIIAITRTIWWLIPLSILFRLPPVRLLLSLGYQWVASHRHCGSDGCSL